MEYLLTEMEIRSSIKLILNGDHNHFAKIVSTFQDSIYSVVLSQVGNPEIAKEISQETFIRAFKYLKTYKADSSFKTWLTRIAINRTKSYFSSRAYRTDLKSERFKTCEHEKLISETSDKNQNRTSDECIVRMREEIAKLKDKYKEVVILKVFEGLSYQEISNTLNIPVGTVSSRMNTALLSLRSKLKEVCQ